MKEHGPTSIPQTQRSEEEAAPSTGPTRRPISPGAEEILGLYFPVLDHGFVALVDYMGNDDSIERAARVSYGYGTRRQNLTRGLIRYLRRHQHTTPSEMVEMKFHCCMPMFVARQWIRHRTACLAGDSELVFDLPGAEKRGERQCYKVRLDRFFRMWSEGTTHPIAKKKPGYLELRSCDESTGEIIHTSVLDVWESGEKPVFRVKLANGRSLKMSKDHRCLTERGWLTLEQATGLRVTREGRVVWRSDDAPAFAVNGEPAHQNRDWLAQRRDAGLSVTEIADLAGVSYHTVRKYLRIHGLQFTSKERGRLSGAAQRGQRRTVRRMFTAEQRAAVRLARSGPRSNFWKGGVSTDRENIGRWTTEQAGRTHARFGYKCVLCGSKKELHAHHIDPVWHNVQRARDADNLVSLCRKCHDRVHALNLELELLGAFERGEGLSEFWLKQNAQPRHELKRLPKAKRLVRTFVRVESIELIGTEMTYDIEVAGPWHNFVANGFIVHNSVNEYSGRYSLIPLLFYTPPPEQLQTQSPTNNQGRSGSSVSDDKYRETVRRWNEGRRAAASAYEWMTAEGIARELARIDLPVSTYTQWYWKIDLHNLLHFLTLRVDAHAQWEIQEYGRIMAGMLQRVAPLSYEAWLDYDVCGSHLSRMELEALRALVTVDGGALAGRPERLEGKSLAALGLSPREVRELLAKLLPRTVPNFELDLSTARTGSYFSERFRQAVPAADRLPSE